MENSYIIKFDCETTSREELLVTFANRKSYGVWKDFTLWASSYKFTLSGTETSYWFATNEKVMLVSKSLPGVLTLVDKEQKVSV